jgi:predicted secreted hydrolase
LHYLLALALVWLEAFPGYRYQFPRDHFDHPGFRTEWWYYTGNLRAADGHRYGFELVFFRQGQRRGPAENSSAWRVDDLYLAHLAWTDIDGRQFHSYRRLNRAGPGIAGASLANARVWNGNWQVKWDLASGRQELSAVADDVRFTLHLVSMTPPVINGENGIGQKAEGAGKASYYVSLPRLAVEGTFNGAVVTGLAWMDHEWFTHQLDPDQRGWDWFSIQLDNGTELMLFQIRRMNGSIDPYSAGTFVSLDGRATHLRRADFSLSPESLWTSPKTGARYPVSWTIHVPSLHIDLRCEAAFSAQELAGDGTDSHNDASPDYWEGAVVYSGTERGAGYLEMTGYARPMRI